MRTKSMLIFHLQFIIKKNNVLNQTVSHLHWLGLGLYKVEFRILEIRISGETNLKKHFLSGNWIRKKISKGLPNRKEWCVLHNFKQPNCLVAFH